MKHENKARTNLTWIMTSLILIIYVITVLWYTVLKRPAKYQVPQYELFWSYRKWLSGDLRFGTEIIGNILMFMPFGFLLYDLFCKWQPDRFKRQSPCPADPPPSKPVTHMPPSEVRRCLLIIILALAFSLLIEFLQFALVRGLAELDDLFSNTLGAVLGILSFMAFRKLAGEQRFHIMGTIVDTAFAVICFAVFMLGRETEPIEADNAPTTFCFQIDEASTKDNQLTLKGFAFGYNHHPTSPRLILRQMETGDETELEVTYGAARPDINDYFRCDYDYTNVGFTAFGIADSRAEYEIMIRWPLSRIATTGVYISGNDIHRVPYGDVAGSSLPDLSNDFATKGTLLLSRPDCHMWVYQYDGALYWVADEDFPFEDDGMTFIQCRLWTTQVSKLPEDRPKSGRFWDNISGHFEAHEFSGDYGRYRVMRRYLPTEYSITSILTGCYKNKKWVWADFFRPVYKSPKTLSP